ncbi:MAG: hypothetical protein AAFX87_02885 [Bacteroidota bacterium]
MRLLLVVCLFIPNFLFGQIGGFNINPHAMGMGNTTILENDPWSTFTNPAGISGIQALTLSTAYHQTPVEGIKNVGVATVLPVENGTTALSISRVGDDLLSLSTIGFNYASHFGLAKLGARIKYAQYVAESTGTKGTFQLDLGGMARLSRSFVVGAYILNVNQTRLNEFEDERAPTILSAGFSYQASKEFTINGEVEKDIAFPAITKVGIAYQPFEKFVFRAGFHINPRNSFFGLGFKRKRLAIDYALQHNPVLGISHQTGLIYSIPQKRSE